MNTTKNQTLSRIKMYFMSRYQDGSCEYVDKAKEYFSSLYEDFEPSNNKIKYNRYFRRVFKHFHVEDDKIFIFYSKKQLQSFKQGLQKAKELSCSPDIKENIIKAFYKQFGDVGECSIRVMNDFIREEMRMANIEYIDLMHISQPRLSQMLIKDLEQVDEYDEEYWMIPRRQIIPESSKDKSDDAEFLDIFNLGIITEPKTKDEHIDYSEDNEFLGKFDDFRITRRMLRGEMQNLVRNMLSFAFIVEGDTFGYDEWGKLKYAVKNRLDDFDDKVDKALEAIVDKNNDEVKIKPELN